MSSATLGPISNATVRATSRTSCSGSDSVLTLGTTNAGGVVNGSLPYGSWRISVSRSGLTFAVQDVDTRASGTTTVTVNPL